MIKTFFIMLFHVVVMLGIIIVFSGMHTIEAYYEDFFQAILTFTVLIVFQLVYFATCPPEKRKYLFLFPGILFVLSLMFIVFFEAPFLSLALFSPLFFGFVSVEQSFSKYEKIVTLGVLFFSMSGYIAYCYDFSNGYSGEEFFIHLDPSTKYVTLDVTNSYPNRVEKSREMLSSGSTLPPGVLRGKVPKTDKVSFSVTQQGGHAMVKIRHTGVSMAASFLNFRPRYITIEVPPSIRTILKGF